MLQTRFLGVIVAVLSIAACTTPAPENKAAADTPASTAQRPGSDRDAHGCIPSAGYAWCARTDRCERPWELARVAGFENEHEAFDKYCKNPTVVRQ